MGSGSTLPSALECVAERFHNEHVGGLAERVYAALRSAILSGDLRPDTWVRETELAKILNVSRTPLREALLRLTGEGLLNAVPNKGVIVRGIGREELRELYEILLVLEVRAVQLAAECATGEQIQKLSESLDLTKFLLDRERWEEVTNASVVFHSILYEASGNRELAKLIETLRTRTHSFRRFGIRDAKHLATGLNYHRAICDAIRDRDGELAALHMHKHLLASMKLIMNSDA